MNLPDYDEISAETELFHKLIREIIIVFLLSALFLTIAHLLVHWLKESTEDESFCIDKDDRQAYQVTLGLCTVSLAVALAASLILPFSIISNELLVLWPKSHYLDWLNSSLIQGLWTAVAITSALALVVLLPFGYLLLESQGFSGSRGSLTSRMGEAGSLLALLEVSVSGITWMIAAPFFSSSSSCPLWSALVVPLLQVCTLLPLVYSPLGLCTAASWLARAMARCKPRLTGRRSFSEHVCAARMEERSLRRRLVGAVGSQVVNGWHFVDLSDERIELLLSAAQQRRETLEYRGRYWWTAGLYIFGLACVIFLWILAFSYVTAHLVQLVMAERAVQNTNKSSNFLLGAKSVSSFGWPGSAVQVSLVLYLHWTSIVGAYSLPPMSWLRPQKGSTNIFHLVANCVCLLVLSITNHLQALLLGISDFIAPRKPCWTNLSAYWRLGYPIAFLTSCLLFTGLELRKFSPELWLEVVALWKATRNRLLKWRRSLLAPVGELTAPWEIDLD